MKKKLYSYKSLLVTIVIIAVAQPIIALACTHMASVVCREATSFPILCWQAINQNCVSGASTGSFSCKTDTEQIECVYNCTYDIVPFASTNLVDGKFPYISGCGGGT